MCDAHGSARETRRDLAGSILSGLLPHLGASAFLSEEAFRSRAHSQGAARVVIVIIIDEFTHARDEISCVVLAMHREATGDGHRQGRGLHSFQQQRDHGR
ncbi:unnamed protein product [Lampetra fluviatilis]